MKKIILLVMLYASALYGMEPIYETLAKKKVNEKISERTNSPFSYSRPFNKEEYYSELLEKYKEYDGDLKEMKHMPEVSVWGGINYAMTLQEMKQKIKATFEDMKKNGLIISKDKFESIKDKYFLLGRTNLTRIWGGEYLKEKISASPILSKSYAVPKYIIVLDNPRKISVDISFRDKIFAIVTSLNNGKIYFEKIEGNGVAVKGSPLQRDIGIESGIGYVDFGDPGNVIKQVGTNTYYIVDTEYNSFDLQTKMNTLLQNMLEYASDRFKYLNREKDKETYEFDL